jgi:hypothetical protein
MTVQEIEVLMAMLEAISNSQVRVTPIWVPPGSPEAAKARIELEAAGKPELAFVHRELSRARQFAFLLCDEPLRGRLDGMTALSAREARRGFDGLEFIFDEMALDLAQDVSNFATWPGIARSFLPCARALLEAAKYAPSITRRGTRAEVERRIGAQLAGNPRFFEGWTHQAGEDWLRDQGILFSSRSLKEVPIWIRAKAPEGASSSRRKKK